jgi:hypothetical protein
MSYELSQIEVEFLETLRGVYRSWAVANTEALDPALPMPTWVLTKQAVGMLRKSLSLEQRNAVLRFMAEVMGGVIHSTLDCMGEKGDGLDLQLVASSGERLRKDLNDHVFDYVPAVMDDD